MQTIRILVEGNVQGVFFRQATKEECDKLGIKGKVKNLPDDSVEIVATGDKEKLQKLIEFCKTNPGRSEVKKITTKEIPLESFRNFSIAYF
jgi:acylphosphatase